MTTLCDDSVTLARVAYAAGIVDGEGHVGIKRANPLACQQRRTPGYHARITVRMVDPEPLRLLASLFGGSVTRVRHEIPGRRPLYHWQVSDAAAESTLRQLRPFLIVKRPQARVLLTLRRLQQRGPKHRTKIIGHRNFPNKYGTARIVPTRSFSDEYVGWCESLRQRCKDLNGRAAERYHAAKAA